MLKFTRSLSFAAASIAAISAITMVINGNFSKFDFLLDTLFCGLCVFLGNFLNDH